MSFFTNLLETTPHFGKAIEQAEQELKTTGVNTERLKLLVHLSYFYAHVQLQTGVSAADEAIILAETLNQQGMKANALCAKAMNEFRIGYLARAKTTAHQALSIFENIRNEEGICDALFQLGSMPHISVGAGDTPTYLADALERYKAFGNESGIYLVRIQQTIHSFYATRFEDGEREFKDLIAELTAPHQRHLLCFAYQQLSLGLHIKEDVVQFMNTMLEWQKITEANGNFHDYTMTKCMLPDCYRLKHLDKDVIQACLEGMECAEKMGSVHGTSVIALIMAHMCVGQGQYEDALNYYRKANDLAREIEDIYKIHLSLNAIGAVYLKLGKFTQAREAFETVQREATVAKDRINLFEAHRNLADLAFQQGDFDRALFDFKTLIDSDNFSDRWNMQDYGNYASSIAKASDDALNKAGLKNEERNTLRLYYLKKYLDQAQHQQNKREEANACNGLAEYYEETNDLSRTNQYRKNYIQLYKDLVNEESIKSMSVLRMQYETEKKEQKIELLKKENEQSLLNERLRISRELHDEVGATLSSISIFSQAAIQKNESGNLADSKDILERIGETSREVMSELNDTVWLINPHNDNLQKIIQRISNYALPLCTTNNIHFEIKAATSVENVDLSVDKRKAIYLIIKEAVHNSLKYAAAKNLVIQFGGNHKALLISIKDDGIGFDENNSSSGNGLRNMKQRAKDVHGKIDFDSIQQQGTEIILQVPITSIGE